MQLIDVLILVVIAAVLGFCIWFIYRSKKKGNKCIGCPDSGKCSSCCYKQ